MQEKKRLRIAIPKKGRLRKPIIKVLKRAGYVFNSEDNILHSRCSNALIDFIFLRADDIPTLTCNGKIDLGLTGKDNVIESELPYKEWLSLEMGKCRLALAGQSDFNYTRPESLRGKKIATSFPNITKNFLDTERNQLEIIVLNGSIEVMLKLGVADAVVDIVETGNTLKENNLKVWETMGEYYVGVFSKPDLASSSTLESFIKRLKGITIANHYSVLEYNIKKENLKEAEKITPGLEAPTVSSLDNENFVAVKVMIKKDQINHAMDELEALGASGIFEIEINNCRL